MCLSCKQVVSIVVDLYESLQKFNGALSAHMVSLCLDLFVLLLNSAVYYKCNEIHAFTWVDIRQMQSLASKLACGY